MPGNAAEHLLFSEQRRGGRTAGRGADLRERREQLLSGLRGTMGVGESVQSVGHCFEFVFQGVDRLSDKRAERVASMRSNKITRIDTFWQGQYPQVDQIFFEECQ